MVVLQGDKYRSISLNTFWSPKRSFVNGRQQSLALNSKILDNLWFSTYLISQSGIIMVYKIQNSSNIIFYFEKESVFLTKREIRCLNVLLSLST
jgi:hypothetical protein